MKIANDNNNWSDNDNNGEDQWHLPLLWRYLPLLWRFKRQETKIPAPSGCYRFAHVVPRLKGPKSKLITLLGLGHLIQKVWSIPISGLVDLKVLVSLCIVSTYCCILSRMPLWVNFGQVAASWDDSLVSTTRYTCHPPEQHIKLEAVGLSVGTLHSRTCLEEARETRCLRRRRERGDFW